MTIKFKPAIAASAFALFFASPAAATEDDFNIWTGQFVSVDLGEKSDWYLRVEAQ